MEAIRQLWQQIVAMYKEGRRLRQLAQEERARRIRIEKRTAELKRQFKNL